MPNPLSGMSSRVLDWGRPTPRRDDLHPTQKDDIFRWQIGTNDFTCIDADTLLRGDIAHNESTAHKTIAASHKIGIIDAATGHPVTSKVDKHMVNKMPFLSERKQRNLVLLLFFMEEENTRWKLLSDEEDETKRKLDDESLTAESRIELEHALTLIRAQKAVPPSKRDESGRIIESADDELPTYEEAERMR